jgi:hypothetical protein
MLATVNAAPRTCPTCGILASCKKGYHSVEDAKNKINNNANNTINTASATAATTAITQERKHPVYLGVITDYSIVLHEGETESFWCCQLWVRRPRFGLFSAMVTLEKLLLWLKETNVNNLADLKNLPCICQYDTVVGIASDNDLKEK